MILSILPELVLRDDLEQDQPYGEGTVVGIVGSVIVTPAKIAAIRGEC